MCPAQKLKKYVRSYKIFEDHRASEITVAKFLIAFLLNIDLI